MKPSMKLGAALSLAATLTACGGGDETGVLAFEPGEVVTFTATLPDGRTEETHYLMHGVTADGDLLVDEASAKVSGGPHKRPPLAGVLVALPLEPGDSQQGNTPRLAALRAFYKQLWQGIAARRNDGSDIAAEIGAYETDVGALYDDWRQSGFATVREYVDFYAEVGDHPYADEEMVEEDLVSFFYLNGWSQGAWVQALQRQGLDWPRFLELMAQRGHGFADLLAQYREWSASGGMGMDAFIAGYVAGAEFWKTAGPQYKAKAQKLPGSDLFSKAKASNQSGANKFYITKRSLNIPISLDTTGLRTWDGFGIVRYGNELQILLADDKDAKNYRSMRVKGNICPTRLKIKGRLGIAEATLEWKLGYKETEHSSRPGKGVSSFGMDFLRVKGGRDDVSGISSIGAAEIVLTRELLKSLRINVEIRNLRNIGSEEIPEPGFSARVTVTPRLIFNSPWVRDCVVR